MKIREQSVLIVIMTILAAVSSGLAKDSEVNVRLEYVGAYESNIFHATLIEQPAMLNVVGVEANYKNKVSRRFQYQLTVFGDIDLYPGYSTRNKSAIGFEIKPIWRYNRAGRFVLDGSLSRRNKDLVNDAGDVLSRTLKKWDYDVELIHKYSFGKLELDAFGSYASLNYDEAANLLSYDYTSWSVGIESEYEFSDKVKGWLTLKREARDYSERKSYSVALGTSTLSPFEIRAFNEYDIEAKAKWEFVRGNAVSLEVGFVSREENFENFYGYNSLQSRISFDLRPFKQDRLKANIRLRTKDYDNFWTSRTGPSGRVDVDYNSIQIENTIEINRNVGFVIFFQNYDKTSNDANFAYADVTAGCGFVVEY